MGSIRTLPFSQSTITEFAFRHNSIGIAVVDQSSRWMKVNTAFFHMLGYSELEIREMPCFQLVHHDDLEVHRKLAQQLLQGEREEYGLECRLIHKTGVAVWVESNVTFVCPDPEQQESGYFMITIQDMTKQKKLKLELGDRRLLTNALLHHTSKPIFAFDRSGGLVDMNVPAEQLVGYSLATFGAESYAQLIAHLQLDASMAGQPQEQPAPSYCETIVTHRNGHKIRVGIKYFPIVHEQELVGFYLVCSDLANVKKSQASLLDNLSELQGTVREQLGMTFKYKEIDGKFIHTFCDGGLMYKFGRTPDQVVGKEMKDFLPLPIALEKEDYYRRAWEGEENVVYEGHQGDIYYTAMLKPLRNPDGEVYEVLATCLDITDRKAAEDQLKSTKELMESLIHNSSDAILVLDLEGNVIRSNESFQHIYGWSEQEVLGKAPDIYPHSGQHEFYELAKKLADGLRVSGYHTKRRTKDGLEIDVSVTMSAILNKEGEVFAYNEISRDITERKATEEYLKKTDRLHIVGQLAAGLAHEIRNPLTSLRGFLQLNKHQLHPNYYEIMISELDRINGIVSDFLMYARPQLTNFTKLPLCKTIQQVIAFIEPQALLSNVRIQTFFPETHSYVHCSEVQIKQVFMNLLKNAMEAMPAGGDITVTAQRSAGEEVSICVRDYGVGIPQERMSKLGEPFYTTKEKGTGLGLMMCFKIIESHGGRIHFRSYPQAGTEVEVVLPLDNGKAS